LVILCPAFSLALSQEFAKSRDSRGRVSAVPPGIEVAHPYTSACFHTVLGVAMLRRTLVSFLLTVPLLSLANSGQTAQEPGKPAPAQGQDKKEERPSQKAVQANNTVVRLDQAFGPEEKQRLDVYAPRDAKGAAVVLFVHGGEWAKGDKADVSFKPKFLNE